MHAFTTSIFGHAFQTPDHLLQQLLPREDNQIGFQEFLGVVLCLGTFACSLAACLWISCGDNDGVLFALKKGNGRSPEDSKIWLAVEELDRDLRSARVENKTNIADGPTRGCLTLVNELGAKYVSPTLPDWAHDIWHMRSF